MDVLEVFESLNPEPATRGNPGPEHGGRTTRRKLPRVAAAIVLLAGLAAILFAVGRDDGSIEVASVAAGQPSSQPQVPSDWQATNLGGDPPAERDLWQAETEITRYASLVNHAENVLQVSCLAAVGIERPDINILATRGRARPRLDFELAPFASDGGYSLISSRAGVDTTIGPEANALSAQYAAYVNSLVGDDLRRHEAAAATCRGEGRVAIFAPLSTADEFYRLVNIGINLSVNTGRLVEEHEGARQEVDLWRSCMADAGHRVASREDAIQSALAERYGTSNTPAALPGPTELAVSRADRRCSASLGYTRSRGAALGAAERYLIAHDDGVRGFFADWNTLRPQLRASLENILGAELVDFHLGSDYVATGAVVDTYFPTRASFEHAFIAELILCAESEGITAAEALDAVARGRTGWWLLSTIDSDRARIAEEGSGILLVQQGESRDSNDDPIVRCAQQASLIVSPKQRVENDEGFNEFFTARDQALQFRAGLDEERSFCMQAAGFDLARVAANHERSFELLQQVNAGEIDRAEALRIDIELASAHFGCSLSIDSAERFRIFSEEVAEAFLDQQ